MKYTSGVALATSLILGCRKIKIIRYKHKPMGNIKPTYYLNDSVNDIMSASEPKLAYGERRMSIMNAVHDIL